MSLSHAFRTTRRERGFLLVTVLLLVALITMTCLLTLRTAHLHLLVTSSRAQELRTFFAFDVAAATNGSGDVSMTLICWQWTPSGSTAPPHPVARWHWQATQGYVRQRDVFVPRMTNSPC